MQKIKREHDIRFLENEEHLQMEGDVYPTTQTSTQKFVEEVIVEIMQVIKAIELF